MALLYPLQMLLDYNFDTSKTGICKCSIRIVLYWVWKMDDSMADREREKDRKRKKKCKMK